MAERFRFAGFDPPRYTQVPDALFDELLPELTGAELKVLLYICRRTFGFRKAADDISLAQLTGGITTKDGRVLDRGTGLAKATVITSLKGLVDKEIVISSRNYSSVRGDEPTTYSLKMRGPVSENYTRGDKKTEHGGAGESGTQQTVLQETERQETDPTYLRMAPPTWKNDSYPEDRQRLLAYVEDIARELGDTSRLRSSVSRTMNLYKASGLGLEGFTEKMLEARAICKESVAKIRSDGAGKKKKMAYFFGCLEKLIGVAGVASGSPVSTEG